MTTLLLPTTAFLTGIASHLLFFHHGERHMYPFRYIQAYLLLYTILTIARSQYTPLPLPLAMKSNLSLALIYFSGLYLSLVIYRLFLNPLNTFPGPYLSRLSKFDTVFRYIHFDGHHQLLRLHRHYNTKFLRIGPNDLSVIDPDAVQVVSAPNSLCTKAQWYSQDAPLTSMHTTRDRATHDRRRKVWAPAFSDRALRGYEMRIQRYNDLLLAKLADTKVVNASEVFNQYSFDVMGDLAFGRSFGMLESGETHWAIQLLSAGMDPLGFSFPPWLFRAIVAIPGATKEYWRFIEFCSKEMGRRMGVQQQHEVAKEKGQGFGEGQVKEKEKDISHVLIENFEGMSDEDKRTALPMLQGDSRLIIVAGSDTTAATLVHLFYWLAKDQELVGRLREELGEEQEGHQKIRDAELLNGCIYEALRLNPPVPSGVFRNTPKEGIEINGTFVPGNTCIQIPGYVMGHDEDNYASAESFIPERWSSKPEMVKHKDAWNPFSSGPFGCIGKNLALMEIRLLTSQIIRKFDFRLADGEDGHNLLMKTTDHFTMGLGSLRLVFEERKGKA